MPARPAKAPDSVRIDAPEASALNPASAQQRVNVRGYQITGNTIFDLESLLAIIGKRTGSMSLQDLYAIVDELTAYYRDQGYLLARAYLPQQEIKQGLVTITVLEGRYDQIAVSNTGRVGDRRALRTMTGPLCSRKDECTGALVSRAPVERGLLLLNDTPGAQAAARLAPGKHTGTSTLGLEVAADPLVSGSVQLDNAGSYYSGVARGIGTLWINSPTGIGDQVTLQGVATAVHGNLYYGTLGYGLPLGYSGARLGVRGSYLQYELGDKYESLEAHGTVMGGDAVLVYPFIRSLAGNLSGTFGYGQRRFHDEADAVSIDSRRRISDRMEAGLSADHRDELFGIAAHNTLSLIYTVGDLQLDDTLAPADALSARTAGSYEKWMAGYSRLQPLIGGASLFVRIAAQGSSGNLDAYEKFALGGPDSVRAYPASETLVDEAVLFSAEYRQRFGASWTRGIEAVLFYDRARGDRSHAPWDNTPNSVQLSGIGVGLNWALTDRMMLRSTVAFRGDRPMTAAPDRSSQYNLSLSTAF